VLHAVTTSRVNGVNVDRPRSLCEADECAQPLNQARSGIVRKESSAGGVFGPSAKTWPRGLPISASPESRDLNETDLPDRSNAVAIVRSD
jgi:hypothetical protein